jgi:hypothetical protein
VKEKVIPNLATPFMIIMLEVKLGHRVPCEEYMAKFAVFLLVGKLGLEVQLYRLIWALDGGWWAVS